MASESDENYEEFQEDFADASKNFTAEQHHQHQHDTHHHYPHQKLSFDNLLLLERGILIALASYIVLVILIKV
jgi:hypothetical protein